jgi:hypothetical protein
MNSLIEAFAGRTKKEAREQSLSRHRLLLISALNEHSCMLLIDIYDESVDLKRNVKTQVMTRTLHHHEVDPFRVLFGRETATLSSQWRARNRT